jgi:hypothetical protein
MKVINTNFTEEQLKYILAGLVLGVSSAIMFENDGEDPARCLVTIMTDLGINTAEETDKIVVQILKAFGPALQDHRKGGHEHDSD